MKLNKKRKIILAVVVVLILLPAIFWKQIAIRYHIFSFHSMVAGMKSVNSLNQFKYVSLGKNDLWQISDYNLVQLVKLDYLQHVVYTYKNIKKSSPESKHLRDVLWDKYPVYFEFSTDCHFGNKAELASIEIWYEPKYHGDWQKFFKETDVPDYKSKFQVEDEKEVEPAVNIEGE